MSKTCNYVGCQNPLFGGGYCRNHQYYRTDKKPSKPREKKRIRQVSKKQAKLNATYSEERIKFLTDNPLCIANLENCTRIATDVHHSEYRGINLLNISTWLPLCRNCHDWVHNHPKEAREKGLLK